MLWQYIVTEDTVVIVALTRNADQHLSENISVGGGLYLQLLQYYKNHRVEEKNHIVNKAFWFNICLSSF